MSQQQAIGLDIFPGDIARSYITDDGTAVPALHILNVNGLDSTESNDNGILTRANPNLSDNLEVVLTNRLQGSATSTNGATADIITFGLGASVASYRFSFDVAGRDTSSGNGVGYTVFVSAKTNGAAASIIAAAFIDSDEDASLVSASIDAVASGNSIILRATGVAAITIAYKAVGSYVVV